MLYATAIRVRFTPVLIYQRIVPGGLLFPPESPLEDEVKAARGLIGSLFRAYTGPQISREHCGTGRRLDENQLFFPPLIQVRPALFRLLPRYDVFALGILPQDGRRYVLDVERGWW